MIVVLLSSSVLLLEPESQRMERWGGGAGRQVWKWMGLS